MYASILLSADAQRKHGFPLHRTGPSGYIGRMAKNKTTVENVRASHDGHEYHEAWAARRAMQLLWPDSPLAAIAVEGPSPSDLANALAATVEISDLTFYYGKVTFEDAKRVTVTQLKYSEASKSKPFRASDAKETIEKFARSYLDRKTKFGAAAVKEKLDFEIVTNRPIYEPLLQAIAALASGKQTSGEIARQAQQFRTAAALTGPTLTAFARKVVMHGGSGSLPANKDQLAALIVDWSATNDSLATGRLGQLRQMVRDKAGLAGQGRNLIGPIDILAALHIADVNDLLPCKSVIPTVGPVVEREQLPDALRKIAGLSKPMLIHATGGVGKTVFLDSLVSLLGKSNEVVFFDCFGGGAYRSPEDARHLPRKGLLHIANTLAFRGLCDPILPDAPDSTVLLKTFRRRLVQCVKALKAVDPKKELVLLIDAIDNADDLAKKQNEIAFPKQLLESFHHDPISGVKLVLSCRTERKPTTHAVWTDFPLLPFTLKETAVFLRSRLLDVSDAQIKVAQARSGGNPRVLDYLIKSGRGLLDESEINKAVKLDDLIQKRITDALSSAIARGYSEADVKAFLAGLAVLPPPVPLDEYAGAHGMQLAEIESFAADLADLLERTNQGLMFRDEPTETLIHGRYGSSNESLRRVADNLLARQDTSVYAARALPGLLHRLGDGDRIFQLAFDDRIPNQITSTVGIRNIKYARLRAAALYAAIHNRYNHLVRLLLELSTIAAVDQLGAKYIFDHPEIVAAASDVDAKRRLFEARIGWPGSRHARLSIVNYMAGDTDESHRHAVALSQWMSHYRNTDRTEYAQGSRRAQRFEHARPELIDFAALPFIHICEGRPQSAVSFFRLWYDWHNFEVCQHLFDYLHLAASRNSLLPDRLAGFIQTVDGIGPIAATLAFHSHSKSVRAKLVSRLAKYGRRSQELKLSESYSRGREVRLEDGLRKAVVLALSDGATSDAIRIGKLLKRSRPHIWAFRDEPFGDDLFPFLFNAAVMSVAKGRALQESDLVPEELASLCRRMSKGADFSTELKKRLQAMPLRKNSDQVDRTAKKRPSITYDDRQRCERFIDNRLQPLLALGHVLTALLAATPRDLDKSFNRLISVWEDVRQTRDGYSKEFDRLFKALGLRIATFFLWTRTEIKPASIKKFLTAAHSQGIFASSLVEIVAMLAERPALRTLAGQQASNARSLIESEDNVTRRASQLADLARAMLPASRDDAATYFKDGLEQLDAIGSGDYEFTNELVLFASALKGNELDERDFHTLSNICELNLSDEPHKFFWGAYARGMSSAAGIRGLAKLSRWDDRSKIGLDYTLLPYLTALVEIDKLEPELAVALNRLADPAEYFESGSREFAKAVHKKVGNSKPHVILEMIDQYEADNPHSPNETTLGAFAEIADSVFGKSTGVVARLRAAQKQFGQIRTAKNERSPSGGSEFGRSAATLAKEEQKKRTALKSIAKGTNPVDPGSLGKAIDAFNKLDGSRELCASFFDSLRAEVQFPDQNIYIKNVAALEQLYFYWKLDELKACRESWLSSSVSVRNVLRGLAIPFVQMHLQDLVDDGRLSGYLIKEISEMTGAPMSDLILELIKVYARPESQVSGAVWMAFATFICEKADDGQGQLGLKRLLESEAASLANNVADKAWQQGLYPPIDQQKITGDLIWKMLGAPYAENRWRAAHSIRSLARLNYWPVIDYLVERLSTRDAGPFQASELKFYYLHARLWLLIALARIALDYPEQIAKYTATLMAITLPDQAPHALMQLFASRALHACVGAGALKLSDSDLTKLRRVNVSAYARGKEGRGNHGDFYQGRPESAGKSPFEFTLDYEFRKTDAESLRGVFGQPWWTVTDFISKHAHDIDPTIDSMYDDGGRAKRRRDSSGMDTAYHSYGEQVGWHATFLAAAQLLKDYPIVDSWWGQDDGDPWAEWLRRYDLTRTDGYWLSDATDRMPLDATQLPSTKTKDGDELTGKRSDLLALADLAVGVGKNIVVDGSWPSQDGIDIRISSALVIPKAADRLAKKLAREQPMAAWLPHYSEDEDGTDPFRQVKKNYLQWIVTPSISLRLDEHDPYGSPAAADRRRIFGPLSEQLSLSQKDRFGREWTNGRGSVALRAEAWGRKPSDREGRSRSGSRLRCSRATLKSLLANEDRTLVVLIRIERYENGFQAPSRYWHSLAVVTISQTLSLKYYAGRTNHLHKSTW